MSNELINRQYVGARYVPKIMGEWNKALQYEALSVVTYMGNSFTSKVPVPANIEINNEDYWVNTGNYNAQVENYRQEINALSEKVNETNIKLKYYENYVTPEMFGAVGDGTTDDSDAFLLAIASGKNILLNEKTYLVRKNLYINAETQCIQGFTSRSVILGDVPADTPILTIYTTSKGNNAFNRRIYREGKYGFFCIKGVKHTENALQIAGTEGTEYEGSLDCITFEHIMCSNVNKAFVLGAHLYRCLFLHCDAHIANYCLYSLSATDTGEVTVFQNCGFWHGAIYCLLKNPKFIGCTFHLAEQIANNIQCCHYFNCESAYFSACHIEPLLTSNFNIDYIFYFQDTCAVIEGTDAIASKGNYSLTCKSFILSNATSGNGRSNVVKVINCAWKYLLSRINFTNSVTEGNVIFEGMIWKRAYDNLNILSKLYSYSPMFNVDKNNTFDIVYLGDNTTYSTTQTDGKLNILVNTTANSNNAFFSLLKKKDVSGFGLVNIQGTTEIGSLSGEGTIKFLPNNILSCISFADENNNIIDIKSTNESVNLYLNYTAKSNICLTLPVPVNAKYCYYGITGIYGASEGGLSDTVKTDLTFEFA